MSGLVRMIVVTALCGAALGACSTREYLDVNRDGDHTALPAPRTASAAQSASQAAVRTDQCGAASLQYLIGRQKTEIPVAADLSRRRVLCTTCVATGDYRADRQTILYDEATKAVTSVTCG